MTYNVRYFAHAAPVKGAASTRRGVQLITDAIATLEALPHVICLQEVETRSIRSSMSHSKGSRTETQIQSFMKILDSAMKEAQRDRRYRAHYYPAHTYRVGRARIYTTGLAILVRSDLKVKKHNARQPHDITHRPNGRVGRALKQSRICAHLIVGTGGGESYDIFNTHLSLPNLISRDFYKIPERMGYGRNQAKEIQTLANFVWDNKTSDRYLVMGDFNSLPGSPAYELITDVLDVHDPFPDLLGMSLANLRETWPTAGFLRFRMRLDHIFAGPGLTWLDFEDTHPFGSDGRWSGLSDHVPIVGRFAVR